MAKQQQLAKQEEQQQLPANTELDTLLEQNAGAGVSNRAEDNIVPNIVILQPLSPVVVESRIPGAKPGDFLIGDTIIPGDKGFWFQPCYWDERWLEFQPLTAGGGFVAMHEYHGPNRLPPGAHAINSFHFKMGDNELIHYRQWAGLIWDNKRPLERTINFKSTGHTIARQWNNVAREANRLADGRSRALYAHVYHLTTERVTNSKGTWFQLKVGAPKFLLSATNIVGDIKASWTIASALNEAFAGGTKQAAVDDAAHQPLQDDRL